MGDSAPLAGLGMRRLQILGKCPIHLALEEVFAVDQQHNTTPIPNALLAPLDRQYRAITPAIPKSRWQRASRMPRRTLAQPWISNVSDGATPRIGGFFTYAEAGVNLPQHK